MEKNYYIGLDMGTDSVGWAVTDEEYRLLKAHGKELWGSYLFDAANTAQIRRSMRTARRRLARVHQRLMLLQELFAPEIEKIDPLFFIRMNNSKLFPEDKDERIGTKNILFNDAEFKDKDYYKKYPTIYHLRSAMLNGEVKDVRLLYLVVHHIVKNRGHFLFESQTFHAGDRNTVFKLFEEINTILSEMEMPTLSLQNKEEALDIICDREKGKKDKLYELQKLFALSSDTKTKKQGIALLTAIVGGMVNLKDLYVAEDDYDDINKFSFDKPSFDETDLPMIEKAVGYDNAELVRKLKAIYDWAVLCNILNGQQYICQSKMIVFDKHKQDLAALKEYVRTHCPDKYKLVFRHQNQKVGNYADYIGMDRQHGYEKCTKDEFYAFLKKTIQVDNPEMLAEMDNGTFMPKQVSNANGIIPYQVHLQELQMILKNAAREFPFLLQESDGLTVSEKIEKLITFRIPYYVGPLNNQNSKIAWVKKYDGQERIKITPWNFDSVVDKDASEQEFIRRMTSKCTYLVGEDVLPASSLLYSKFVFLNELNNLKTNGSKDMRVKELIFSYAKEHKKVTLKNCCALLIREGVLPKESKANIVFSGLDGDFTTSLGSYNDFRCIVGDKVETQSEMCEEIILWITLISDKSRLQQMIAKKYGKILTEKEIKSLKSLNYTKWGRFSSALLTQIKCPQCTDENGELLSIIDAMCYSTENLMQLLSNAYGYKQAIDEYNSVNSPSDKVTYQTVEDLYCSPSVKRSIWRSVCLVREIIKIQGCVPKKIFIEMAREVNDDSRKGKRTISRKQQLIDLYKNIKDESHEWQEEINRQDDHKFNSDKLVLYYRQMGRSAYSGKPISIEDVFNTKVCDIDHIFPQSKIKDDSLDNRVLVFQEENRRKTDIYPISEDIRHNMRPFWNEWKEKGLISERKYERLIRNTPLSQTELADFINRQLVETRQSTKAAAELLKKMLPDTSIVYAKAGNADVFKKKNKIVKVRELNDLHHAKDAYINIVVGNVYDTKFCHNAAVFFKNNNLASYNLEYLYVNDIPGAWKVSEKERIVRTAKKNTCSVVRFTSEGKGKLYNATIHSPTKKNGEVMIPLKESGAISDTSKYGGYDSAATAYFMLVKSVDKKEKAILSLETISILADKQFNGDSAKRLRYCTEKLGLQSPEIMISLIKPNTLFCINGSYAYIRGKTGNQIVWCNANELILDDESLQYLKYISNYFLDKKKLNCNVLPVGENITATGNNMLYDVLVEKLSSKIYAGLTTISGQVPLLRDKKQQFIGLTLEDQCTVLMEILHLMQCNSTTANLQLIGGSKNVGKIQMQKSVQDKKVKMILQSPTGYYRTVVDFSQFL